MAQAAILDKCDLCDTYESVDYFCIDCLEILCSNCKSTHSKNRKTRKDRIIALTQAKRDNIIHKIELVYCNVHATIEMSFFCLKCDKLICTQCLVEKHNGHDISTLDEIRDSKIQQLNKIIEKLKVKRALYENALSIEGQVHNRFSKSIDQAKSDIIAQKAKIIEELNSVCDEQFVELEKFQQNEDKRYSSSCNEIQEHSKVVDSAIHTGETSIASNNTALIVQATTDATKSLNSSPEPIMPPAMTATYHHGDRSRPAIYRVQGKIKIDVNNSRIDVSKVRVKSSIKVSKDVCTIDVIVSLQNETSWVKTTAEKQLWLIDKSGKIIAKSVKLDDCIHDAKEYDDELLLSCSNSPKLIKMSSSDGKTITTFSDLSPFFAGGLCITKEMDVMVCLVSSSTKGASGTNGKIVRLGRKGEIKQTIEFGVTGTPLFNIPSHITSLATGEIIVTNACHPGSIVGVNRKGQHLFTWKGEIQGKKLDEYRVDRIAHDSNNVFVTDFWNHRVYALEKDGSGAMCLLDKTHGIERPDGIAVDSKGQIWIGCQESTIHIIEY